MLTKPKLFTDSDVKIHVHVCTYNEELLLPHFINHYKQYTDHIFVHDQHSTDNTVKIAKEHGCIVDYWGSDFIDDDDLLAQKHKSYYSSKDCDYVFIVDCDDFIMHSDLITKLNWCKTHNIKVPNCVSYNMWHENFNFETDDITDIRRGEVSALYTKSLILKSNEDIQYSIGCHILHKPEKEEYYDPNPITYCHMKWINFDYIVEKHKLFNKRLSEKNLEKQWGYQYTFDDTQMKQEYERIKNNSSLVIKPVDHDEYTTKFFQWQSFRFYKFNHVWLYVIDNVYMVNVTNFIKSKFDTPEYANTIIMIGINYCEIIPECRKNHPEKKLVAFNWEQLVDGNHWIKIPWLCESTKEADEVWDYNDLNALYLKQFHDVTVSHVYPFEYYKNIEVLNNKENPEIDILFYGGFNQRRAKAMSTLWEYFYNKYKVIIMFGQTIEENYKYIENSKIVINIHGLEPWSRQEQERIGFLVGNKKCVISEISQENYFSGAILEGKIQDIPNLVSLALTNDNWKTFAINGYQMFKENKCKKIVNY